MSCRSAPLVDVEHPQVGRVARAREGEPPAARGDVGVDVGRCPEREPLDERRLGLGGREEHARQARGRRGDRASRREVEPGAVTGPGRAAHRSRLDLQLSRRAAVARHDHQPAAGLCSKGTVGDPLSVGRPARLIVDVRVGRQRPRLSALRRDRPDVPVPRAVALEDDRPAVGRPGRVRAALDELHRRPPGRRHEEDVAALALHEGRHGGQARDGAQPAVRGRAPR